MVSKSILLTYNWTCGYLRKSTEESDLEALLIRGAFISPLRKVKRHSFNILQLNSNISLPSSHYMTFKIHYMNSFYEIQIYIRKEKSFVYSIL